MHDLATIQSAARVEAVKRKGLREFARQHWRTAEPAAPFVDSWAFGAICEFLQAWRRREFKTGVIGVPPGNSKSLLAGVFFPAWVWAEEPQHKLWCASFDEKVVLRDAHKSRDILLSHKFLQDYPDTRMRDDNDALGEMWTQAGGLRFSSPIGGRGTGWHFNSVIVDDPCKPQAVLGASRAHIEMAKRWRTGTLPTRMAEPTSAFGLMLIMQRLVEDDLAGEELERDGVEHLCLPMRYVPKAHWIKGDYSAKLDPRTEPGELLNPTRFNEEVVRGLEIEMASNASAQLQQNPTPRTGGMLDEAWLRWEWVDIPYRGLWVQEWDLSGKGTDIERHSAVHGALWCAHRCERVRELLNTIADREKFGVAEAHITQVAPAVRWHLIDEVWGVWPFEETIRQILAAQQRQHWQRAIIKRIEEKASGIQALQVLQSKLLGVQSSAIATPDHLKDDKITRFRPIVPPAAEAGLILLPPWRRSEGLPGQEVGPDAWRKELLSFPRASRDDRVDTTSSAGAFFQTRAGTWQDTLLELARQRPPV